jgi:hypothetical protein
LAAFICSGCGKSGPERFAVSGAVTFKGAPVPGGQIIFEPDSAAGNSGPSGYADIVDGHYDTATDGKGTIGGPHVVRITGLSGKPGEAGVQPLFKEYQSQKDLPRETSTADFDVPESASQGVVHSNEPPP